MVGSDNKGRIHNSGQKNNNNLSDSGADIATGAEECHKSRRCGPRRVDNHPAAEADTGHKVSEDVGNRRSDHERNRQDRVHNNGKTKGQRLVDIENSAGNSQLGDGSVVLSL